MRKIIARLTSLLMTLALCFSGINLNVVKANDSDVIEFPDEKLEAAIKKQMSKSAEETITVAEAGNVRNLDISKSKISDLTGIEYFTSLWSLNIGDNEIVDLTPLAGLSDLHMGLDIGNNLVKDITPLSNIGDLSILKLGSNPISSIEQFSSLTKIRDITFRGTQMSDLSVLNKMPQLLSLTLENTSVSDLKLLEQVLFNLEKLTLKGNPISDITPIWHLKKLTELCLSDTNISDIEMLEGLLSVVSISLENNKISDITPLISLANNLNTLSLAGNQISDITPLNELTGLVELNLANNNIKDITQLSGMKYLGCLLLDYNPISDLSPIFNLTGMNSLSIKSTKIDVSVGTDARKYIDSIFSKGGAVAFDDETIEDPSVARAQSSLFSDTNLESVIREMTGKSIGELSSADVKSIKKLDLTGKGIRSLKGLEYFIELEELILDDNPIGSIKMLANLSNIKKIDITATNIKATDETLKKLKDKGVEIIPDDIKEYKVPKVEIDYNTALATVSLENTTSASFEYCVSTTLDQAKSKGKWEALLSNQLELTTLSGKKVYIREVGATTEIAEITVANIKKPDNKLQGISFEVSTLRVINVDDTMEYRFGISPWRNVDAGETAIDVSMLQNGGNMEVRAKAVGNTPASAISKIKIPAIPAAPKVTFDYSKAALKGISANTQVSTSAGSDKQWGNQDDVWEDMPSTFSVYGDDVLYFRNKPAKPNAAASKVIRLEIGEAAAEPANLSLKYTTMTISGATTSMQYQIKKGDTLGAWTNVKLTADGKFDIKKLASETDDIIIYIRTKGTAPARGETIGVVPSIALSFEVKKIPVLQANPTYADGKLTSVSNEYEYSIDGKTWTDFTSYSVSVSDLTGYQARGFKLKIRAKGNAGQRTPPSQIKSVTIPKQS